MPDIFETVQQHGRQIDARLRRLVDRVRRRFLVHGAGWILAAVSAGILVYFVLDRLLDLPAAVRVILSAGFVTYLVFGMRRRVLYPLRKQIAQADVALAIERRFPDLQQRLISAIQLADRMEDQESMRGESSAMAARVVDEAAAEIERLPVREILDPKRTVRVWAAAAAIAVVMGVSVFWNSAIAGVFFVRMLGSTQSYPRETRLFVELPIEDETFQLTRADGVATVVMPAGGDLPVLVRVEGTVPRDVLLVTEGGRGVAPTVSMAPRGENRFRHVFRRVHEPFTFHARGGDDPFGDTIVTVETIEPPRVATIKANLTFPAYTRKEPVESVGGSIEAVIGSKAKLTIRATSSVSTARLHLIDSDEYVELAPISIQDDAGTGTAYTGELSIERSDRYQVEFVGPNGIGNPHPGNYPIVAVEDHAPIARLLRPATEDLNVVLPTGVLPIHISASDDFGVEHITATTIAGKDDVERRFELFQADPESAPQTSEIVRSRLVEVAELGGERISVGDTILVSGTSTDNREPEASTTDLVDRQVHVVDTADLARRISSHFRRIRDRVEKALSLQVDRRGRLDEIRESMLASADVRAIRDRLITIEVGQGRVLAESRRFHRELMRSFDVHLFNRLEESLHAPKVVQMYVQFHADNPSTEAFPPAFYRQVADARRAGTLGAMEKTLDPILAMVTAADQLSTTLCPRAVKEVESAGVSSDRSTLTAAVERAAATQVEITQKLEMLRGKLDEWNEFQDVITQTRSIRDKQKDIRNRTRTLQRGTK